MLMRRLSFLVLLLGLFALLVRTAVHSAGSPEPALLYTVTPHYVADAWLHGADRFPQAARLVIGAGPNAKPLAPSFYSAADANISFDAKRLLFAGKAKAEDKWQIWEVAVAGGDPAQITACDDDCVRPFYLPDDRFVYAHRINGKFALEVSTRDRSTQVLSSIPGNALPSDVLRDGRILFQAGDVLRDGRILFQAGDPLGSEDAAEIFTVYADGSGIESYRCDHGHHRGAAKQLASGDIVFADDHGLARFTSSLAHQVDVGAAPGEYAGDVVEDRSGDWLVSVRKNSNSVFELQRRKASGEQNTVIAVRGSDVVEPRLLSPRPIPNRHPPALHDWDGANLLCLNAYTSKLKIEPTSVASMRLYTRSANGEAVLVGSSPVEKDGSFFVHVPSDRPLQIELLDHSENTVQREHGWFWTKRGEQRECVGCHAGPERAPENAVPAVLLRSTDPVDMTPRTAQQQGVQ
jgi:hypothetical protein